MAEGGGGGGGKTDARVAFIQERLAKAFPAIKPDRFSKAFNDADNLYV